MRPTGCPPGSALQRGMRFARWAMAKPKPPTVEEVMAEYGLTRYQARIWRSHWLNVGPHFFKPTSNDEETP